MNFERRHLVKAAAAMALAPLVPRRATALDYPIRPIRIIVGLAAGGPTDATARIMSQAMAEQLGKQLPLENRTGAGGSIGTQAVINAQPDGYTILFAGPVVTIGASLYRKLEHSLEELAAVAPVMRFPNLMLVTPSLPVQSVAEFIDYAKAHPGELSMASSGVGASPHLTGDYFKSLTKIDMVHVPYRGSGAAYPDLMSGKVHVLFDNLGGSVLGMARSGQLRALGVTSAQRWPLLSDIPAIAETVPGYEIDVWYGVFAPRDTPTDIVALLNATIGRILNDPKIITRFAEEGGLPMTMPRAEFINFAQKDRSKWHDIIQRAGIQLE